MSTTTEWDLGPDPFLTGKRKQPYQTDAPTAPPQEAPVETVPEPLSPAKARRKVNPLVQWYEDMRNDTAARKARSDGRWWFMRCMGERPTSVRDHLDFVLHQRKERPNGGRGWGLRTQAPVVDAPHAIFYVLHGLLVALPVTLACYAVAWIAQRPGRSWLAVILAVIVKINLSTWLS